MEIKVNNAQRRKLIIENGFEKYYAGYGKDFKACDSFIAHNDDLINNLTLHIDMCFDLEEKGITLEYKNNKVILTVPTSQNKHEQLENLKDDIFEINAILESIKNVK